MFKRPLTQSDILLIAANLLPVVGAIFWNWNAKEMFLVYCLETIIIGVLNLVKMAIVTVVRKTDTWYNQGSSTSNPVFSLCLLLGPLRIICCRTNGNVFGAPGMGDGSDITVLTSSINGLNC